MAGDSKEVARAHLADAGVEELPDGWDVVTLGDLFTEESGIAVGVMYPGDHDADGVPLIKAGDLNGSIINPQPDFRISTAKHHEYRRTALEGGELLMTLVGNVGQCAVVPPRMAGWNTARAVAVMRLADSSETHFVQQCLLSRPLQHLMDVWCNTTVQATLNLKEIRQLPLPWPPKKSRDAIAAFGRALDDKIDLNRRMNATLEAMARALFQSWFVDFDPVRAKLDGRQPAGLDPATATLFPAHFDHKAEGIVPTGWNLKRWGDIATLEYGKSIRDYRESSGKYRVFGTNGPIGFHDEALCNSAGIVIGRKGAYRGVHYSPEPYFVIDTAFYLKPKAALDLKWAYYELLRFDINSMDSGSAIPSTSRDDFYGIPVIVPPPETQAAFGKIVGGWFAKVFANDHESRTLATLRDSLLPKLLSGELSIENFHPSSQTN